VSDPGGHTVRDWRVGHLREFSFWRKKMDDPVSALAQPSLRPPCLDAFQIWWPDRWQCFINPVWHKPLRGYEITFPSSPMTLMAGSLILYNRICLKWAWQRVISCQSVTYRFGFALCPQSLGLNHSLLDWQYNVIGRMDDLQWQFVDAWGSQWACKQTVITLLIWLWYGLAELMILLELFCSSYEDLI
jgi:hypothetical protein